jgi:hypothetical protein
MTATPRAGVDLAIGFRRLEGSDFSFFQPLPFSQPALLIDL